MSKRFAATSLSSTGIPPPPAPLMQIHCTSIKVNPTPDGHWKSGPVVYNGVTTANENSCPARIHASQSMNGSTTHGQPTSIVASVNGESIGAGPCRMYASLPRKSSYGQSGSKGNDPQVNKLVYNMYRELLNTKHERASNIVNSAPQENVTTDEGVANRVVSMMRQRAELKGGKMEAAAGPPPPPPPPPFQTEAESARPVPTEASAVIAMRAMHKGPPAALAGAMLKDKKPFTYTPGGLDLSEINAQPPPKQSGGTYAVPVQMTPTTPLNPDASPLQSRSFKVIQNVLNNHESANMSDPCEQPEPRKYTGSNIPSRSFKMLQAMTDENETCPIGSSRGLNKEEIMRQSLTHAHSNIVSPTRSYTSSPTIHYLNSNNHISPHNSDTESSNTKSFVTPSYTTTRDSPVYRHVSPKFTTNGTKSEDRVVSKALINRRNVSPPRWQNYGDNTGSYSSPVNSLTRASSAGPETSKSSPNHTSMNNPARLFNFVERDNQGADFSSESSETKLLYGGDKIPSRVFRQLQQEFPPSPRSEPTHNSTSGNASPSSQLISSDESLPVMVNCMYISNGDNNSPVCDDLLSDTKASVMKELTSQFDPRTNFKKPKAAPGRVFKYLQETYDSPTDGVFNGTNSSEGESNSSGKSTASMSISSIDDAHYDAEPKPYGGGRLPGRTFKMIQDNIETHPSVLQARK